MQSTLSALCLVVILRFGRESEGDQSEERSFSSLSWSDECSKAFRGKGSFLHYYYFNLILYIDAVESHQHSSKKLELPKCPGFLFFQQWPVKEKCNSSTSIYSKVMTRIDLFFKKRSQDPSTGKLNHFHLHSINWNWGKETTGGENTKTDNHFQRKSLENQRGARSKAQDHPAHMNRRKDCVSQNPAWSDWSDFLATPESSLKNCSQQRNQTHSQLRCFHSPTTWIDLNLLHPLLVDSILNLPDGFWQNYI